MEFVVWVAMYLFIVAIPVGGAIWIVREQNRGIAEDYERMVDGR